MYQKSFDESFKVAYAISLVGRLGFYIVLPFLLIILGGRYLDEGLIDKYLFPGHSLEPILHYVFVIILTPLMIIYYIWQIRNLISRLIYREDPKAAKALKRKSVSLKNRRDSSSLYSESIASD